MDLTNFWFSSGATGGGGGGGDQGEPINQSLRFRGAQQLAGPAFTGTTTSGTFSFWLKLGAPVTEQVFIMGYVSGAANGAANFMRRALATYDNRFDQASDAPTTWNTIGAYRDPSAWYHICYRFDPQGPQVWINGVRDDDGVTTAMSLVENGTNPIRIGNNGAGTSPDFLEGYLADFYFIDGQALEPTAFGRFNDNGVWVPREVDFTPAEMRFSDFVTTADGGGWFQDRTPDKMFNPSTTSAEGETMVNDNGDAIVFRPVPAINFTSSVEVFTNMSNGAGTIFFNDPDESGTGTDTVVASWQTIATGSGTLEEILVRSGTERANCCGIRVDGEQLLNPFLWSAQCFTSAATATPDLTSTDQNWEAGFPITNGFDGNLTNVAAPATAGGWSIFRPNTALTGVTTLLVESQQVEAIWINGNSVTVPTPGGTNGRTYDLTTVIPAGGTIENLSVKSNAGQQFAWYGITINGQILTDGVNNSYGANGFHLEFADPDNLGLDTSGNGNNFTATGFDTDPVGIFSNDLAGGTESTYQADAADRTGNVTDRANAFDGNISSSAFNNVQSDFLYFNPTTPLTGITSLFYRTAGTIGETRVNGNTVTITSTGTGTRWVEIDNPPATLNELAFTCSDGFSQLVAVGINGTATENILVDNTGIDYDLMQDSPTQNWATGNPLPGSRDISLANANLTNGPNQEQGTIGTIMINSGRWYFESVCQTSADNTRRGIGVANNELANTAALLASGSANVGEWYFYSNGLSDECELGSNGTWITIPDQDPDIVPNEGDVMKLALDMDTGEMWYGMNDDFWLEADGTPRDDFSLDNPTFTGITGPVSFTASTRQEQPFIFGQQNGFLFAPPAGFEALQTQNLPTPTILDGSDNFRALTGAGANILAIAQGTNNGGTNWNPDVNTGFTNGLWWIKDMDNTNQHQLVDSVRGGNLAFTTPAKGPQAAYVPPTGNSVAWCWGTDNTGLNTNAGFQILTWTGTGAARAISHDLDQSRPLDMILVKMNRADPGNTYVNDANIIFWNSAMPNDGFAYFNLSNQFSTQNTFFNGNPNATLGSLTVGTDPDTNANPVTYGSAADYVGYVWQSIPGYSAFGSYSGNQSTTGNGPFIYLGFRPAWVMIKCSDIGSTNWVIDDATRSPFNPVDLGLLVNETDAESSDQSFRLDFLSNGFKVRSTGTGADVNRGNLVYAAFAENPFGGENTAPANAR